MLSNPTSNSDSSTHTPHTTSSNPDPNSTTQHEHRQPPAQRDLDLELELERDIELLPPSSVAHLRPGKAGKNPAAAGKGKRVTARKWKRHESAASLGNDGGPCHLFTLPEDVLHLLCTRLPPRDLQHLASTCRALRDELSDEAVWRQSYINRFLWQGAAYNTAAREEVKVLVQGCMNVGTRGWRQEALSREVMLHRWADSNAKKELHNPFHMMVVNSLSLSYPAFNPVPSTPRELVVGKMHSTPSKSGKTSPTPLTASPSPGPSDAGLEGAVSPSPKLTHRQKYEAMLAATTRPRPELFSACIDIGSVVKSDPFTGKISKGFWGPAADSNFYIHPHLDAAVTPTSMFMPKRSQTHILWGLVTGGCVHTAVQSRKHTTSGGRAASVNTASTSADAHEGAVLDIWQPETTDDMGDTSRWVTAGADGRVKYWQLQTSRSARGGKRTPTATESVSTITCLFSSDPAQPMDARPEVTHLRQTAVPDEIILARCNVQHDVVCGVTTDGDLRVWFDASTDAPSASASLPWRSPTEFRLDVGAADQLGGVHRLELDCREYEGGLVAIVLIHHERNSIIARYDITRPCEKPDQHYSEGITFKTTYFATPTGRPITTLFAHLHTSPPIGLPRSPLPSLLPTPTASPAFSPSPSPLLAPTHPAIPVPLSPVVAPAGPSHTLVPVNQPEFGRFVAAGDEDGHVYIWAWDGVVVSDDVVMPIRAWPAVEGGKVTTIEMSCGLVAVGSYDGKVSIFDPLPYEPELLRTFTPPAHLTPADLAVAAGDTPQAVRFNVNQIILENDLLVASIGRRVMAWRAGTAKGRQSGKETPSKGRRSSGGKVDSKSHSRVLDMRALHQDAQEDQSELRSISASQTPTRVERQHRAAMEDLGLEDGDDALQYALMLSRDEAVARGETVDSGLAPTPSRTTNGHGVGTSDTVVPMPAVERVEDRWPSWGGNRSLQGYEDEYDDGEEYEYGDEYPDEAGDEAVRAVAAYEQAEADDLAQVLEMIRIAEERDRRASGQ